MVREVSEGVKDDREGRESWKGGRGVAIVVVLV